MLNLNSCAFSRCASLPQHPWRKPSPSPLLTTPAAPCMLHVFCVLLSTPGRSVKCCFSAAVSATLAWSSAFYPLVCQVRCLRFNSRASARTLIPRPPSFAMALPSVAHSAPHQIDELQPLPCNWATIRERAPTACPPLFGHPSFTITLLTHHFLA